MSHESLHSHTAFLTSNLGLKTHSFCKPPTLHTCTFSVQQPSPCPFSTKSWSRELMYHALYERLPPFILHLCTCGLNDTYKLSVIVSRHLRTAWKQQNVVCRPHSEVWPFGGRMAEFGGGLPPFINGEKRAPPNHSSPPSQCT